MDSLRAIMSEPASSRASPLPALVGAAATVLFTYFFPRWLLGRFGLESPWTSHWYLYGFGGGFFLLGLWVILRSGACRPGRGRDRFWLVALIVGFLLYLGVHTVWILAALHLPYKGAL